jgi:riboflavin kinase/FMN adenylyltransferase
LSFEPHPITFFRRVDGGHLLTLPERRAELLSHYGVDHTVYAPFDADFAHQTPEQFVGILRQGLGARALVVGEDFRFGRDRSGGVEDLRRLFAAHGDVHVLSEVSEAGLRCRSSAVREALQGGDLAGVRALTGREFMLRGQVVQGQGRGAELGFPTANLACDVRQMMPAHGVYRVRVQGAGFDHAGVMNLGRAPTLRGEQGAVVPEVHVLDHQGELYGVVLQVSVVERLRGEQRFESLDALKAQIAADVERVRALEA